MNMRLITWFAWCVFVIAASWCGFVCGVKDAATVVTVWVWLAFSVTIVIGALREKEDTAKLLARKHPPIVLDVLLDLMVVGILVSSSHWVLAGAYLFHVCVIASARMDARRAA